MYFFCTNSQLFIISRKAYQKWIWIMSIKLRIREIFWEQRFNHSAIEKTFEASNNPNIVYGFLFLQSPSTSPTINIIPNIISSSDKRYFIDSVINFKSFPMPKYYSRNNYWLFTRNLPYWIAFFLEPMFYLHFV